jgi:CrcB protein
MNVLMDAGAVALGAMIGAPSRFFLSGLVARRLGETFPWGTMAVNLSGALLIGVAAGFAQARGLSTQSPLWGFAVTGVLGSYTTVSSLALHTRALSRDGEPRRAAGNVAFSVALGVAATAAGLALGAWAFGAWAFART